MNDDIPDGLRLIAIVAEPEGKRFSLTYYFADGRHIRVVKRLVKRSTSSIILKYPNADFFEREIYDLYGIRFVGNPNLKKGFVRVRRG